MKKRTITIIRTAVGSPPAAGLIKELQARGLRVVGADCDPLAAGFYLCDKHYIIPKGNSPNFIKEFLKICRKEKPQAIISGPEEEILAFAKNKEIFARRGILVLVPDKAAAEICADKILTYNFFRRENIPTPEIFQKGGKIKFPVIAKPRRGRGSTNVFKAENKNELEFYLKKYKNLIIQEFIKGVEYTVDILSDLDGNPLSIVPRTRILVESGVSMKGKTVYDQEIINLSKKISQKLKLIGPACIQCIKTKKDIKFIEINTRFGGGSILSIKADPMIIPNLIKLIKGQKTIKGRGFKKGLTMLRYYSEVYVNNI